MGTIRSQGIIHGGGKYCLRGVRDFDAVRTTSLMPERWRRSLMGEADPDLAGAQLLATKCHLWLPRGSVVTRLQSLGFMSFVANAGLLATRPIKLSKAAWPEALRDSALAVYSLAEPVIATGSFLNTLAARQRNFIFLYDGAIEFAAKGVRVGDTLLRPRATVLAAGEGNSKLLRKAGMTADLMQSRPLGMVLLRGELPPLFGHCVVRGKTSLTITTPLQGIWQIGGEIAERLANENDLAAARAAALVEIRRWLPDLDLARAEIAIYRAVRAEARTAMSRRPSGVHVNRVGRGLVAAWPTKLSMVPVLADEVFEILERDLKAPGGYDETPQLPTPGVARYPWEEAKWFAVT